MPTVDRKPEYGSTRYSASTRGLRALAGLADDLELDREASMSAVEGLEAVERLQALRKALLAASEQAKELGLAAPNWSALQVVTDERKLHVLLQELEELIRRERERQLELDEIEAARRDMRMLMHEWLVALARGRNIEALQALRAAMDITLTLMQPCDTQLPMVRR